jgi:glycosyltransferase involved in cell wall biosynthesis
MGRPVCLVRTRHNTYPVRDSLANRWLNLWGTDYQIVVCNVVRETLARQRTFDAARMGSIHNGVDAEQFRPDPGARAQARAEFGYTPDHLVCGIAARLVEAKGHLFLLRAVAALRKDLPRVRVLMIGRGEHESTLKQYVKDAGLGDMVTFAGFKDHMAYYVQALDIGVQPSIDCDTSSFSLKEQMAAEKPVIASDYGGLVEIVADGVEGIVVPAGTVEPLAQAIRTLAQHPQLRESMGKAGRRRVLRDFTIEVFGARTVEAYRRAIEIHHERAAH